MSGILSRYLARENQESPPALDAEQNR